jgi:predicted MFS family arabinose efflux permease
LRHRDFRLFWTGTTASEVGNRMATVVVPLLAVVDLHASTFTLGALTALRFTPWLLISLPAGALLERVRRRRVLIACDIAAALLVSSVPVAAWAGLLSIGLVLLVTLLNGAITVLSETGNQAYLPHLLDEEDLAEGNGLLTAGANAAVLVGRGLSGYAVQLLGTPSSLLLDAFSFLVSASCLAGIRRRESGIRSMAPAKGKPAVQQNAAGGTKAEGSTEAAGGAEGAEGADPPVRLMRADIKEGMRFVFGDPYLRPIMLWATVTNFGLTGYQALSVPFLVSVVRVSPALIGLLLSSSGAGAIVGSLSARWMAGKFGTARVFLGVAFLAEPPVLLVPLTHRGLGLLLLAAGTLILFVGLGMSNVFTYSFRQAYPPPGMRARTTATSWFLVNGVYPLGALLGGALGTWAGIRNGIWISLALMLLGNVFLLATPLWRHRDLPSQSRRISPSGPISPSGR